MRIRYKRTVSIALPGLTAAQVALLVRLHLALARAGQ